VWPLTGCAKLRLGGFAGLLWLALATVVVPVVAFAGLLAKRLAAPPVTMPVHA
jgi:hypothetical protein